MLQSIREHIQGWIAGIIIALIAVAFVIWGIEFYLEEGTGKNAVVAKVNGAKISEKEFNIAFQQLQRSQLEESGGVPPTEAVRQQMKQYVLQELITSTALLQAALNAGFHVSMEQVKQLVLQTPEFQVNGRFSEQRFQQYLYASASNLEEFFQHLQASLITNQVAMGIQSSAFVLPKELQQAYELIKEKRSIGYFIIPSKKYVSDVKVTQQDIENYYQQNRENFKTPEKVSVNYLMLSPQKISQSVNVTEQEARQYYQANQVNYTIPKRWRIAQIVILTPSDVSTQALEKAQSKINRIAAELKAGKSFEDLIKQKLLQQKSTTQWVSEDEISDALANVLSRLQPNQISSPFRTKEGFMIIKLLAVEPKKVKSFEEVKASIEKALRYQKAEQIFNKKSDQLSNLTYTNPNTLDVAAKEMGLPVQSSVLMTREGEKTGIFSDPKILAVIFSNDVLQQGNNSNPIGLKDGGLVVVRVKQHVPSRQLDLAAVSGKIKNLLVKQMAERKAGLLAYQIQSALSKNVNEGSLAKRYGLNWIVRDAVSRSDKTLTPNLISAVFNMMPSVNLNRPSVTSVLLENGNYVVIKLLKVITPDYSKAAATERNTLNINLANFMGQLEYRLYVSSVMSHAKIRIY